jgi:enamine deaminase RidA (YjgF/YER057c/UK114 family)
MQRQTTSSGAPWEAQVGYSRAVRVGPYIHVAGTTASQDGQPVAPGDPYGQTRHILRTIQAALHDLGAELKHVVRTRMYVIDINHWPEVGRAHGEFFRDIRPASTLLAVHHLLAPELLVEIEADAIVPPADA